MAKTASQKTASQKTAKHAAKPAAKTIKHPPSKASAPAKVAAHKPKVAVPAKVAAKPVAAAPKVEEVRKPMTHKLGFKVNEFVVYPAHGVGQILLDRGAGDRRPQA